MVLMPTTIAPGTATLSRCRRHSLAHDRRKRACCLRHYAVQTMCRDLCRQQSAPPAHDLSASPRSVRLFAVPRVAPATSHPFSRSVAVLQWLRFPCMAMPFPAIYADFLRFITAWAGNGFLCSMNLPSRYPAINHNDCAAESVRMSWGVTLARFIAVSSLAGMNIFLCRSLRVTLHCHRLISPQSFVAEHGVARKEEALQYSLRAVCRRARALSESLNPYIIHA